MLRGRLRKSKLQVDLPKLVVSEPDKEMSPRIAGDWLTLAGPAMRDLRPTVRNGGRKKLVLLVNTTKSGCRLPLLRGFPFGPLTPPDLKEQSLRELNSEVFS